jgi:hypothetical protein
MARPRKPAVVNEASGLTRERSRHDNRKPPVSIKLGEPDTDLDNQEREIWLQTLEYMWWLKEHHRVMFALYVRLIARMRNGDTGSEVVSGIIRCSSKLGGDPCSDQMFSEGGNAPADEFMDD